MSVIPLLLRRQIGTASYELIAVAEKLRPAFPTLAEVYKALGQAIDSSQNKYENKHIISFELPANCQVTASGKSVTYWDGPVTISLLVDETDSRDLT